MSRVLIHSGALQRRTIPSDIEPILRGLKVKDWTLADVLAPRELFYTNGKKAELIYKGPATFFVDGNKNFIHLDENNTTLVVGGLVPGTFQFIAGYCWGAYDAYEEARKKRKYPSVPSPVHALDRLDENFRLGYRAGLCVFNDLIKMTNQSKKK